MPFRLVLGRPWSVALSANFRRKRVFGLHWTILFLCAYRVAHSAILAITWSTTFTACRFHWNKSGAQRLLTTLRSSHSCISSMGRSTSLACKMEAGRSTMPIHSAASFTITLDGCDSSRSTRRVDTVATDENDAEKAAVESATRWLALQDDGNLAASWEESA